MRLIDVDDYCKNRCMCNREHCDKEKCSIYLAPIIDPASLRPKGEWITASFWKNRKGHHVQIVFKKCSLCNIRVKARWNNNFCPNCGVDMRTGANACDTDKQN